jgi:hypothetical protein
MPEELKQLQEDIGSQVAQKNHKKAIFERVRQIENFCASPGSAQSGGKNLQLTLKTSAKVASQPR